MTRDEKLKEVKEHPERHRHTFEALQQCCWTGEALDLMLMQKHEGVFPGRPNCDVSAGHCACGGHHPYSAVDRLAALGRA